ncbi:MAG: hypothetical protein JW896_11755 [Deltaproteobacteria bacterium]|nr:hypothetical protein [Deltaproteobacteria bacterium]
MIVKNKKVALFVQRYLIGSSPTIVHAVECLVERGYAVDLIVYRCINVNDVTFDSAMVRVIDITKAVDEKHAGKHVVGTWQRLGHNVVRLVETRADTRNWGWPVSSVGWLHPFTSYHIVLSAQARAAAARMNGAEYTFFIGFDTDGLNLASRVKEQCRIKVPVVYWNLEILFADTSFDRCVGRHLEIKNHHRSVATIIQDEARAEILGRHNRLAHTDMLLLPCAVRGRPVRRKSDYLRRMFHIPDDKKIVLYAGSIQPWAMCEEMLATVCDWPEDWVLVMHTFHPVTWRYPSQLMTTIRARYQGRVFVSSRPVKYEELDQVIAGGDIGIGFYRDSEPGNTVVGTASGKFAYYCRCGIPFITNDYPSLRRIADRYGCAEVLPEISGRFIGQAIEKIVTAYETYRENAFRCFEMLYSFDAHFESIIAAVESQIAGAAG